MSEPPEYRFTDSMLVDALRALGIHSVRHPQHPEGELSNAERAYLLGALAFAVESETSLYATNAGNANGPEAAYDVLAHIARGHAHTAAHMSGTDPYSTPDGMPREIAAHWWFILADRLNLLAVQFVAAQDFGGSAMTNTPAHHHMADIANGLGDVLTSLAALNYRVKGIDPAEALSMLTDGAALCETSGEFLRTTSQAALDLKPRTDGQ